MTEPETVALHWWDPETIHSLLRMVFLCQMIQPEQDLWTGYRKDSHNQRTPASLWAPEPNIRSDESVTHPESLQCSSSQLFTLAWEASTSSCCWPSPSRRARPPTSQSLLTFESISSKSTWLDQALEIEETVYVRMLDYAFEPGTIYRSLGSSGSLFLMLKMTSACANLRTLTSLCWEFLSNHKHDVGKFIYNSWSRETEAQSA